MGDAKRGLEVAAIIQEGNRVVHKHGVEGPAEVDGTHVAFDEGAFGV